MQYQLTHVFFQSDIENNLDSIIKTPMIHRAELLRHSPKPVTSAVFWTPSASDLGSRRAQALDQAVKTYDLKQDPWVKELSESPYTSAQELLPKVEAGKKKPFCLKQLQAMRTRAIDVWDELGPWAADWYIDACTKNAEQHGVQSLFLDWSIQEKTHLLEILRKTALTDPECAHERSLKVSDSVDAFDERSTPASKKFSKLIEVLQGEVKGGFTGIIFVKTRACVAALAQMLSIHPVTRDLKIGTFVGTSSFVSRNSNVSDLADLKEQQESLEDFRVGKKNLIISTNVLEEGIDVPRCNLVLAFEPPVNLVSFIQRRGRARDFASKYIVFVHDEKGSVQKWEKMEKELNGIYTQEDREKRDTLEQESAPEKNDEWMVLRVEETK